MQSALVRPFMLSQAVRWTHRVLQTSFPSRSVQLAIHTKVYLCGFWPPQTASAQVHMNRTQVQSQLTDAKKKKKEKKIVSAHSFAVSSTSVVFIHDLHAAVCRLTRKERKKSETDRESARNITAIY